VLAGVAAAQFGVGGNGKPPAVGGDLFPGFAVVHDRGEQGDALLVGGGHGAVADGEGVVAGGDVGAAVAAGGGGFGLGADGGEAGAAGAVANLPQFLADVAWRPLGLDRVGGAVVQELAVGHGADLGVAGEVERGERFVPGGALVRAVGGGFGADRLGRVVVAVQFPVRADGAGALLPVEPAGSSGTGPRPLTAQGSSCSAACSPIRSLRSSIAAAMPVT
jgi:hypothetical protein